MSGKRDKGPGNPWVSKTEADDADAGVYSRRPGPPSWFDRRSDRPSGVSRGGLRADLQRETDNTIVGGAMMRGNTFSEPAIRCLRGYRTRWRCCCAPVCVAAVVTLAWLAI